jgi:phage terminase Nu1 subunit (DNA packaging protein)
MGTVAKRRGRGLSTPKMPAPEPKKRGPKPRHAESLDSARARKETSLADLRQMEVRARSGELLEADVVRREVQADYRRVRSGVLAVVSRIRMRLPQLTADDVVVIDRELRDVLAELADASDLGTSGAQLPGLDDQEDAE